MVPDMQTVTEHPEAAPEQPRKSSGYRRLQQRHHELIAEHEALRSDHAVLLSEQMELQQDINRLLEQHGRLMRDVKSPPSANWFEGAHTVLNQIATQPDLRSTQVFAGALASLQQKLATIVSRLP
jgi:uncharacterized protein (DUF3084 family)